MGRKNQLSRQSRSPTSFAASLGAAPLKGGAAMSAYQGASHTDLALSDWQPMAGSADADLLPELGTLTSRARDLARNDGLMAGGLQTHRDNVVGAVLRLSAVPDYRLLGWTPEQAREWGNKVEAHFRSWADTTDCDAARTLDLLGLTVLALGGEMVNGDAQMAAPARQPLGHAAERDRGRPAGDPALPGGHGPYSPWRGAGRRGRARGLPLSRGAPWRCAVPARRRGARPEPLGACARLYPLGSPPCGAPACQGAHGPELGQPATPSLPVTPLPAEISQISTSDSQPLLSKARAWLASLSDWSSAETPRSTP
ncbi:phage portal protein [Comamonas testosteroni]|uniref:phage portal protein n=1 Tax=Comamonas testosteroni TaxID=285 RepID=UPI003F59762D